MAKGIKIAVALLLIFCLLVAAVSLFNRIDDKGGESGALGGFFDGIFDYINGTNEPYYVEGAKGAINFDFSEPGVLYEDGIVKYEARDGFLFYGAKKDFEATDKLAYITFPLMKDASPVKITDYNEIEFSFDFIYGWSSEYSYGSLSDYSKGYSTESLAGFFLDFYSEKKYEGLPLESVRFNEGVSSEGYEDYYNVWCPEQPYYHDAFVDNPFSSVSDEGYFATSIKFKLIVDKENYKNSVIECYAVDTYYNSGGKLIQIGEFKNCVVSEFLYGVTFAINVIDKSDSIAAFDNFKVTLK